MVQQIGNGFGVALAALLVQFALFWRGTDVPDLMDFRFAFAAGAMISLSSILFFLPLAPDVAAEVSGHRVKAKPAPGEQAAD
jgi:hypothetical protein